MAVRHLLAAVLLALPIAAADATERATLLARAASDSRVTFDVFVPPDPSADLDRLLEDQVTPGSPRYHQFLKPSEYRARFGTSPARLAAVTAALRASGMAVEGGRAHVLRVSGTVGAVEHAFATKLSLGAFRSGARTMVARQALRLPAALARQGAVIAGFSGAIRMRPHSRVAGQLTGRATPDNRAGGDGPYWFTDLRQAYDLPDARVLNGRDVTIGILMDGGYNERDMPRYFNHEKTPVPFITVRNVYGGAPFPAADSLETHLDIQQSGGMAPKAEIRLYNVPDLSDASLLAGLADIDEENVVDIVSMSFGGPEVAYTPAFNGGQDYSGLLGAYDALFRQGNALGITFVASSGDAGALDAPPLGCFVVAATAGCGYFGLSADFPATSPYVTAVGGTNLVTATNPKKPTDLGSAYRDENAYYDRFAFDDRYGTPAQGAIWGSGGGVSLFEPKPAWQKLAPTGSAKFRTIPDVAGHMGGCPGDSILPCPPDRSSDVVVYDGKYYGVVGTSASAPDFAGILALKAQRLKSRLGNVNLDIYTLGHAQRTHAISPVFRDHIPGNNGYYPATPGYNLVLGNGTVKGRAFIGALDLLPAGPPLTATNP